MLARAGAIWFGILLAAIFNGALRDIVLTPRIGDLGARAVSSLTLSTAVLLVTWISLRWIGPSSRADAWRIGVMWLAMTLAFEFGAGHYVFGTPWRALLADYDLLSGRLWVLVLLATVTAPALTYDVVQNSLHVGKISSPATGDTR